MGVVLLSFKLLTYRSIGTLSIRSNPRIRSSAARHFGISELNVSRVALHSPGKQKRSLGRKSTSTSTSGSAEQALGLGWGWVVARGGEVKYFLRVRAGGWCFFFGIYMMPWMWPMREYDGQRSDRRIPRPSHD